MSTPLQKYKYGDYVCYGWTSSGIVASDMHPITKEYIIYCLRDNVYKNIKEDKLILVSERHIKRRFATEIKVIGYEESANIFNYRKIKSKLVGKVFPDYEIVSDYVCKIDGLTRHTILVYTEDNKKYRFLESDCEFLYNIPKVEYKKHKIDHIIRIGDTVKITNSKRLPIDKNTICKVVSINDKNYKDRSGNKFMNNIIAVINYDNKNYPILLKHLKKVSNDKNNRLAEP